MDKVAFIGLGAMGAAMAWNIHRGGYPLGVYNRTAAATDAFGEAGVHVYDDPRSAAARADVVVIMVTDGKALRQVVSGPDGIAEGITAGKAVINMSTVGPEETAAAAEAVTAKGAAFIDAPVSGTVKPAEDGTLVILASGENNAISRVTPLLKTMGQAVLHCGGVGQGTRMKLVLNLMLGNMMQALAEALMLGKDFDLDAETILQALGNGGMAAPMYQAKGQAILEGRFAKQFPVHLMFKDLNLVLQAAGEARVPLPQTAATRECFNAAMANGLGNEDMAAVVKCLELLTGRKARK